jgi:hypothetical protein
MIAANDDPHTTGMTRVIMEVVAHRAAQDVEWGGPAHDDHHVDDDWMRIIALQMDKAYLDQRNGVDVRDRFLKIAALAVAAVQTIDRRRAP